MKKLQIPAQMGSSRKADPAARFMKPLDQKHKKVEIIGAVKEVVHLAIDIIRCDIWDYAVVV